MISYVIIYHQNFSLIKTYKIHVQSNWCYICSKNTCIHAGLTSLKYSCSWCFFSHKPSMFFCICTMTFLIYLAMLKVQSILSWVRKGLWITLYYTRIMKFMRSLFFRKIYPPSSIWISQTMIVLIAIIYPMKILRVIVQKGRQPSMSCIAIASYTKNLKPAEGLTSIHSNFSILTLYIKSFPCFELFYAHM